MADQNDVHVETIKFNMEGIDDTVATVTAKMLDLSNTSAQAAEGIKKVGDGYVFNNKQLQSWYDTLKAMHLEHNKTTVDIVNDLQNAARAAKSAATATEEYGKKIKAGNEAVILSEENKKRSFEDIGRLLEGEKFGLRQIASNFGLLGPEIVIVGSAIGYVASQLEEYNQTSTETARTQKNLNEVLDKSAEKAAEAVIDVEKMNDEFKNAESVKDRKKALDDYNKTFGETIGFADTFEKSEQRLKDHTQDYIKAMSFRAQADAAYGLQKDALAKAQKAQVDGETSFFGKIKAGVAAAFGSYADAGAQLADSNKGIIKENNEAADSFANIAQKANASYAAIKTAAGGGTGKTDKDEKKKEHDGSIEEEKRYIAESQKITETAREKEITSENIKYNKIKADLIAHQHSTEALTKQHLQNLSDIQKKYDDLVSKTIKDQEAKAQKDADAESTKFFAEQDKERAKIAADKLKDDAKLKSDASKYLNDQFSSSLLELKTLKGHYDVKKKMIEADRLLADGAFARGEISTEDHNKKIAQLDQAAIEIKKQQAEQEKMIVNAATSTLDTLAKIAGEHTAAGKDLAIASATIKAIQAGVNTFEGFTDEFPGPVGIALGAVAAAGVGVALFEQVKKIEDVQIPGSSGSGSASSIGGSGGGILNAPSIPKAPTTTNLSNSSIQKMTSKTNNEPIKAVVSEQDITNSQRRVASFNNGSSLH